MVRMNRMILKKSAPAALLVLLAAHILSGCGHASPGMLATAQQAQQTLAAVKSQAEETYDGLYDDTLFVRVTEAGKAADELIQKDAAAMTDEEIDATLLPAIQAQTAVYEDLQRQMDEIADQEQTARTKAATRGALLFHIINHSGTGLVSLGWVQGTRFDHHALLEMPSGVGREETLAGMTVPINREDLTKSLYLIGKDTEGEEVTYNVGRINELREGDLYYLCLLPEGKVRITTDPGSLTEDSAS